MGTSGIFVLCLWHLAFASCHGSFATADGGLGPLPPNCQSSADGFNCDECIKNYFLWSDYSGGSHTVGAAYQPL
jgi:hypothetical protein